MQAGLEKQKINTQQVQQGQILFLTLLRQPVAVAVAATQLEPLVGLVAVEHGANLVVQEQQIRDQMVVVEVLHQEQVVAVEEQVRLVRMPQRPRQQQAVQVVLEFIPILLELPFSVLAVGVAALKQAQVVLAVLAGERLDQETEPQLQMQLI